MKDKLKVLVTGGSRGIGKAIVYELARKENFSVAFIYNNCKECADEIYENLRSDSIEVLPIKADVSSFSESEGIIEEMKQKLGGIDILINNAGITRDNLLLRMTEEDFDRVIEVNLKSVFNLTKAAIKPMMSNRFGKIINITSVVGIIGNAGQANYAASKAGVIALTKSNAKEFASRNITVNAIAPGFIETDMTSKLNEKQQEILLNNIPLKRFGKPEDVAKVASFLCSDAADYITGQVITVDGGMVM